MISAYNLYDVYCHGLNIQWGGGGVQCVCAHIVQCVQHWLVGWSVGLWLAGIVLYAGSACKQATNLQMHADGESEWRRHPHEQRLHARTVY